MNRVKIFKDSHRKVIKTNSESQLKTLNLNNEFKNLKQY